GDSRHRACRRAHHAQCGGSRRHRARAPAQVIGRALPHAARHFRHEIAHYYWDHLVADTPALDGFRQLFGDEREDYQVALQRYYAAGPASDWSERFVTAYASAHPWEDFAETWAHYFHMVDTLETAAAFGIRLRPQVAKGASLDVAIDFDPH